MNRTGFRRDQNTVIIPKPRSEYKRPTDQQIELSKLKKRVELLNEQRELERAVRDVWD